MHNLTRSLIAIWLRVDERDQHEREVAASTLLSGPRGEVMKTAAELLVPPALALQFVLILPMTVIFLLKVPSAIGQFLLDVLGGMAIAAPTMIVAPVVASRLLMDRATKRKRCRCWEDPTFLMKEALATYVSLPIAGAAIAFVAWSIFRDQIKSHFGMSRPPQLPGGP